MIILVNMKKLEASDILRIFLGIVFILAGSYRVFNWNQVALEFQNIKLDNIYLPILVVAFELIAGLLLILNVGIKKVIVLLIVFLSLGLLWSIIVNNPTLTDNLSQVFTFSQTPVDFFLHFTYLIILSYLFLIQKRDKNS